MSIATRYRALEEELERVCVEAGRSRSEVEFIAVSKTVGPEEVAQAAEAGACAFGENRPDQLVCKAPLQTDVRWHFIGNIQSRRIPDIVEHASLIHSLFTERHAVRINTEAAARGKVQDVLIEVNVSGEESKSGLAPSEVAAFLERCLQLPNLRVCGLMTMAPRADDAAVRMSFEGLRALRDELRKAHPSCDDGAFMHDLSMGMSEDWQRAIAAGATMIRIGRAVFSDSFD